MILEPTNQQTSKPAKWINIDGAFLLPCVIITCSSPRKNTELLEIRKRSAELYELHPKKA